LVDGMIKDGLWCAHCDIHMGGHAEYTARKATISRQRQDEFSVQSHIKTSTAQVAGKLYPENVPVEIRVRKGPTVVSADEGPRKDSTVEALGKLRPAFPSSDGGALTVTAGNASTLNDGGAAVVVTSEAFARANGLPILARIDA